MTAAEILKRNHLNKTHCRVLVLEQLMQNRKAFSQSELDDLLRPLCNRSTLYRILNTFEQKELIIKIPFEVADRYFFNVTQSEKQDNNEYQLIFYCTSCSRITHFRSFPAGELASVQNYIDYFA
ncbi:MAG: transcriptional repressor, partial [Bacteroidota bacterium]